MQLAEYNTKLTCFETTVLLCFLSLFYLWFNWKDKTRILSYHFLCLLFCHLCCIYLVHLLSLRLCLFCSFYGSTFTLLSNLSLATHLRISLTVHRSFGRVVQDLEFSIFWIPFCIAHVKIFPY